MIKEKRGKKIISSKRKAYRFENDRNNLFFEIQITSVGAYRRVFEQQNDENLCNSIKCSERMFHIGNARIEK